MQEYNKGFAAGVCSLAGFIVVYLTTWQLITERVQAKRMENMHKAMANFAMVQRLLATDEEDPADESGSDQASSSASNLSRADVKQGDDR